MSTQIELTPSKCWYSSKFPVFSFLTQMMDVLSIDRLLRSGSPVVPSKLLTTYTTMIHPIMLTVMTPTRNTVSTTRPVLRKKRPTFAFDGSRRRISFGCLKRYAATSPYCFIRVGMRLIFFGILRKNFRILRSADRSFLSNFPAKRKSPLFSSDSIRRYHA